LQVHRAVPELHIVAGGRGASCERHSSAEPERHEGGTSCERCTSVWLPKYMLAVDVVGFVAVVLDAADEVPIVIVVVLERVLVVVVEIVHEGVPVDDVVKDIVGVVVIDAVELVVPVVEVVDEVLAVVVVTLELVLVVVLEVVDEVMVVEEDIVADLKADDALAIPGVDEDDRPPQC